jgi:signal transduction histidine kinase/CheY-like chemotaxis protein/HPt (histidine-containing phosphotransfer) domain-containing protein
MGNSLTPAPVWRSRSLLYGAVVTGAYATAASLGYWLGSISTDSQGFAVWPAIGVGVVAISLGGIRMAWAVVVGGLVAELLRGVGFDESLANGLVSSVNPLLIAAILRVGGFRPSLAQLRNVVVLVLACALATPFGATFGTATILAFPHPSANTGLTWLTWWTGDLAGALLVAPLLFEAIERFTTRGRRIVMPSARFVAPIGVSAVLAVAIFAQRQQLEFLVIPVLLWVGMSGDPLVGATVNAIVAGVGIIATTAGHGPFAGSGLTVHLLVLAAFTATVIVSSLVLCAIAAERRRALEEVEASAEELRIAREAAEDANRAKSGFLATMSHEIRTPMIGVTGMLEVLAGTDLTPHQKRLVATAESSAQSLLQIIGDVLDFEKIEADRLELAPETVDLRSLIRGAAETFVHVASAKGLVLEWTVDDALAAAHVADPLRVRQILCNFLSNAIKFTDVGGIAVAARVAHSDATAQTVELSVTDTGCGLTDEQQGKLFGEFVQAESATAQRFGGTGLGLVICRRLAVLMGGDVALTSRVGAGTTVSLVVPLPIGDPKDVAAPPATALTTPRRKPSRAEAEREGSLLLLVDDHPVNRLVLLHQLHSAGFEVDTADNGNEALRKYMRTPYGLVLTDLAMPEMSGYELAGTIREHEAAHGRARTPIIALSANVMEGEPERCRAAGMDDFAGKPTTIPLITSKLRRWLPDVDWHTHTAEEPAVQAGEHVDMELVAEITGGDPVLTENLLHAFVASSQSDLAELADAVARCDLDRIRRPAHRLKGASLTVGANRLADVAKQLEHWPVHAVGDWDQLRALLANANIQLTTIDRSIVSDSDNLTSTHNGAPALHATAEHDQ